MFQLPNAETDANEILGGVLHCLGRDHDVAAEQQALAHHQADDHPGAGGHDELLDPADLAIDADDARPRADLEASVRHHGPPQTSRYSPSTVPGDVEPGPPLGPPAAAPTGSP